MAISTFGKKNGAERSSNAYIPIRRTILRTRKQKSKHVHYCLLVNQSAAGYDRRSVDKLTEAIKKSGGSYTVTEPETALDLSRQAEQAAGKKRLGRYLAQGVGRRGPITGLVACGGDGTFNLVARAALGTDLAVGILPMGRFNNIAMSLLGKPGVEHAVKQITAGGYRRIDSARVGNQRFFGSASLGFIPELARFLQDRTSPSSGLGWSKAGSRAAADVTPEQTILKIDAFRFEISPIILSVNLLAYACGLPLSNASVPDDGQAEIIFDRGNKAGEFGSFTRLIHKRKYLYGDDVHLYRGTTITLQPVEGRTLYLDGELVELPTNLLEIQIDADRVRVLC